MKNQIRDTNRSGKLVEYIRGKIVSGEWSPGMKLPVRKHFEKDFGAANTVQSAFSVLLAEGFLTAAPRVGTCVSTHPPHLNRIGIAIARNENEVRYWQELVNAARAVAAERGMELEIYRNLASSAPEWERLQNDALNFRISAVISTFICSADSEILKIRLPKAVPGLPLETTNTLAFYGDDKLLAVRGLDYLQQHGADRIAYFGNYRQESAIARAFREEVNRRNLYCPEDWRFYIDKNSLDVVPKIAKLLMSLPPGERPNGIFIADDNFTAAVAEGLANADLPVVSHYNWTVGNNEHFPAKCLGYDLKDMMNKIFEAFRQYHKTGTLKKFIQEKPIFEEEFNMESIKND